MSQLKKKTFATWKLQNVFFPWFSFKVLRALKILCTAARITRSEPKPENPLEKWRRFVGKEQLWRILCFQTSNSVRTLQKRETCEETQHPTPVTHLRCCTSSGQLWKGKNTQGYQGGMQPLQALCSSAAGKYQDREIPEHQLFLGSHTMPTTPPCCGSTSAPQPLLGQVPAIIFPLKL